MQLRSSLFAICMLFFVGSNPLTFKISWFWDFLYFSKIKIANRKNGEVLGLFCKIWSSIQKKTSYCFENLWFCFLVCIFSLPSKEHSFPFNVYKESQELFCDLIALLLTLDFDYFFALATSLNIISAAYWHHQAFIMIQKRRL